MPIKTFIKNNYIFARVVVIAALPSQSQQDQTCGDSSAPTIGGQNKGAFCFAAVATP